MMHKPKILVVGSFVMDQIASTEVFPNDGQTVLGHSFSKAPGGKGANQAVQMARLGADVTMFGKLGRDANGGEMLKVCRDAGIDTAHILYDDELPSGCSVIILEEHPGKSTTNRIIVLPGSNMSITCEDLDVLKTEISGYDLVLLQHEIPMQVNERMAEYAFEAGIPVMLNPAPSSTLTDAFLSHITYISPNEHEAYDLTGVKIGHDEHGVDLEGAKSAAEVLKKRGVKNVLITLGEAGAFLSTRTGDIYFSPCAKNVTAKDPTAAGDSFVGAFSVGIVCGWPCEDAMCFANHTAALTVSAMGAMPSLPDLKKVVNYMQEKQMRVPDLSALKR